MSDKPKDGGDSRALGVAIEKDGLKIGSIRDGQVLAGRMLEFAIGSEDAEALEAAIDWAIFKGLPEATLGPARKRMLALADIQSACKLRKEAIGGLDGALGGAWNPRAVEQALASAAKAGVSSRVLREMEERKRVAERAHLEELQRQQERQKAATALDTARRGSDIPKLEAAISKATQTGVSEQSLSLAKQKLAALVEERDKAAACAEATARLEEAMRSQDPEAIEAAMQRAVNAGASEDVIKRGSDRRQHLLEQQRVQNEREAKVKSLQEAMKGSNIDALQQAIDVVAAFDPHADVVREGRRHKAALEERRKKADIAMATNVLEHALLGEDITTLESAIEWAGKAGVKAELIEKGRQRKLELQDMLRLRQLRSHATQTLKMALAGQDLHALVSAYAMAQQAAVSQELLAQASSRKKELEEIWRRTQAKPKDDREKAKKKKDARQKEELAQESRKSHGHGHGRDRDRDRDRKVAEKDEMEVEEEEDLDDMSGERSKGAGGAGAGIAPSTEVPAASSSAGSHERHRHRRASSDGERPPSHSAYDVEEATSILEFAIKEAQPSQLSAAIRTSSQAGVSEGLLRRARERLDQEIDRRHGRAAETPRRSGSSRYEARAEAEKNLEAAAKGKDLDDLEVAVSEAKEHGVRDDLIKSALRRLEELRVRAVQDKQAANAKKSLDYAMEHGQLHELKDAIIHAVECGVERALVKKAMNLKRELEEENSHKEKAEQELLKAMDKGDANAIRIALESAVEVGISNELADKAWKKQEEILDAEEAAKALKSSGNRALHRRQLPACKPSASSVESTAQPDPPLLVSRSSRRSHAASAEQASFSKAVASSKGSASQAAPPPAVSSKSKACASNTPAPKAATSTPAPKAVRMHKPPPLRSKPSLQKLTARGAVATGPPPSAAGSQGGAEPRSEVYNGTSRQDSSAGQTKSLLTASTPPPAASAAQVVEVDVQSDEDPDDGFPEDDLPAEGYQAMLMQAMRAAQASG